MRIGMHVFFYLERLPLLLQHDTQIHIERRGIGRKRRIVCVFHITPRKLPVRIVHRRTHEIFGQVFNTVETPFPVHHGLFLPVPVRHQHRRNPACLCDPVVIGTECRSYVYYSGSPLVSSDIIPADYPEGPFARVHPRYQLMVRNAGEFRPFENPVKHLVRDELVPRPVILERDFGRLRVEMAGNQSLGHYINARFAAIWVEGHHPDIIYVRADTQGGIRRKCPRGRGPCDEEHRKSLATVKFLRLFILDYFELHDCRGILDIAVTARLVKLMGAEPGSSSRRIRLYRIAFVQKALFVYLLQQVPEGFDITVVVSYIRVVHIHPIADSLGKGLPLLGIFHHLLAAGIVVFFYGNL